MASKNAPSAPVISASPAPVAQAETVTAEIINAVPAAAPALTRQEQPVGKQLEPARPMTA
ncbi:hypothetical protein [Undibacterium sp. TJN19]|uniref:hypothetical protein n=1 Tax=Undibacterium sp. TJN19 TaxID=3413055 RepID=UPI003BF14486